MKTCEYCRQSDEFVIEYEEHDKCWYSHADCTIPVLKEISEVLRRMEILLSKTDQALS